MTGQLFRQQAIDFQRHQRQWGGVVLSQPFSTKIPSWAAVLSVMAIGAFLTVARYSRRETVAGNLTPAAGMARISVPRAGVVRAAHIEERQHVESGQPLLTIQLAWRNRRASKRRR